MDLILNINAVLCSISEKGIILEVYVLKLQNWIIVLIFAESENIFKCCCKLIAAKLFLKYIDFEYCIMMIIKLSEYFVAKNVLQQDSSKDLHQFSTNCDTVFNLATNIPFFISYARYSLFYEHIREKQLCHIMIEL